MADRYQNRPFPSDDYGRGGDQHGAGKVESDPLAELARLIGQPDPFAAPSRAGARRPVAAFDSLDQHDPQAEGIAPDGYSEGYQDPVASQPAWMRRANVQPQPAPYQQDEYPAEHAWDGQDAELAGTEPGYHQPRAYQAPAVQPDLSRYDDALYGQVETGQEDYGSDPAYPDNPYADQDDYPEHDVDEAEPEGPRRGIMMIVAALVVFGFVGTGGAFAYRSWWAPRHSGDPPIIRADNTPTKIVPEPIAPKETDRIVTGDSAENIVPREEAPIDVSRVVLPPSNQSIRPPVSAAPGPGNGASSEPPRAIRTVRVQPDQTDSSGAPQGAAPQSGVPQGAAPSNAARSGAPRNPPTSANASANQPLSLAPQAAPARPMQQTRVASAIPTQTLPTAASQSGGYLVSISSQDSEAAAKASFRVEQGKYPSVLGSRSPVIKQAQAKGRVVYRAMVGPYRTRQEAVQFCTELKAAGGQCFIP